MAFGELQGTARGELCARIDAVIRGLDRMEPARLVDELDIIRRLAVGDGMAAATTLVHAVDRALAQGERGPMVRSWLDTLRELCGCDAGDPASAESFAAAVSVRLG